jgi:hypothetical protein
LNMTEAMILDVEPLHIAPQSSHPKAQSLPDVLRPPPPPRKKKEITETPQDSEADFLIIGENP